MTEFQYASLKHDLTINLGDEIQSIASDRFLPRIDQRFERERLAQIDSNETYLIVLNGWFAHDPDRIFPLAKCFKPIMIGMHIAETASEIMFRASTVEYFKKHEPIGCRDRQSMAILQKHDIDAYYSKCLTLTLPTRQMAPSEGKIFIVDASRMPIPNTIRQNAVYLTHLDRTAKNKYDKAHQLLNRYRDEAKLVITTRLHCALPCVAMGIPVVFFSDPGEYRVSVAADIGLKIHRKRLITLPAKVEVVLTRMRLLKYWVRLHRALLKWHHKYIDRINWSPAPLDIDEEKAKLEAHLKRQVAETVRRLTTTPRQA